MYVEDYVQTEYLLANKYRIRELFDFYSTLYIGLYIWYKHCKIVRPQSFPYALKSRMRTHINITKKRKQSYDFEHMRLKLYTSTYLLNINALHINIQA